MSLVAVVMLGTTTLVAQNVEQGKKFFYYKRYKSARETLEKVLAANPNNIEATYWLGQTLIEQNDSTAAKDLYQKLLQQNGDAPLIIAGMGQIELMEGKTNDARQRFESAISLTKGKDVDVFNAVARANIQARYGDANYAIEKLNQATQVRRFNDPTTYLLMGDAYRKLVDGGNAVTNYEKAFSMDNTLAEAKYNIGKIYLTQQNYSYFTKYMNDAIAADPNYAPAYYDLYVYNYDRDVNEAKENLTKYASVIEPDEDLIYDQTSIEYASRNFQAAIDKSKANIQRLGDKATPRYYKLIGYSYAELKDTANAKSYMDQYFAKQKEEDFVPKDYTFYAQLLARTPGSESQAFAQYEKAIALDTSKTNKLKLMDEAARLGHQIGDCKQEAAWYKKIYRVDTAASNRDMYNWGYAEYACENYDTSYVVFKQYQAKYPDEIYGYLWGWRSAQNLDTTYEKGLAAAETELFTDQAMRLDSVKWKPYIVQGYKILAQYQTNVRKNIDSAIVYLQKVLNVDPEDAQAKKYIDILTKAKQQQEKAQKNTSGTSSSGKAASTSAASKRK
jgi:tetratricopeptide (TPR) repeat protein